MTLGARVFVRKPRSERGGWWEIAGNWQSGAGWDSSLGNRDLSAVTDRKVLSVKC